jgi:hypothetical protein
MRWFAPVIFAAVHVVLITLAWRIRRGATWMLSGYHAGDVADEPGLARWTGTGLLLVGAAGILTAAMLAFRPDSSRVVIIVYAGVVVAAIVVIVRGARRFRAPAERPAG